MRLIGPLEEKYPEPGVAMQLKMKRDKRISWRTRKMRLTPFPSGIVGTILELLFLLGLARRLSDLINSGYRPRLVEDYDY